MHASNMACAYMKMCTILFVIFVGLTASTQPATPDSLQLVQILYRHGDRSPTHPFPTDINNDYWTDGTGQLTNLGKQQHFALGQFIRQSYSGFLNESYSREEILINSTDVDRTLMSAYCNLAGIYSPAGDQVWDEDIAWQPIPVHTRPTDIDYIVEPDFYCPKNALLVEEVKKSPEVQRVNNENEDLYAFVANQTGYDVYDIFSLSDVHDALLCDKSHNLTVPDWVDPLWDQMEYLHNLEMYWKYGLPQLYRLSGGPLVGHMIENMQSKIGGSLAKRKAYVYSSHDTKVAAFLSVLGAWDRISPTYAAAVFVELHKTSDGSYGVQVLYRNDSTADPYVLSIPTCEPLCPVEDFIRLTADSVPEDIAKECILIENQQK